MGFGSYPENQGLILSENIDHNIIRHRGYGRTGGRSGDDVGGGGVRRHQTRLTLKYTL